MTTTRARSAKPAARSLIGTGVLLLAGVILHPHAPDAHNMAQVAYSQTGETAWWPAHLLLVSSYVLFVRFLVQVSRAGGLPTSTQRVLKVALPIAVICILAMIVHLLLPLGHDSVANSHHGWAFWAKDVVESIDGLWAVCVATVAWTLGRTGAIGGRFTAVLGVAGGIGFALFSILIPLTGVVVSLRFTRLLLPVVPGFAILMVAWAVVTGISAAPTLTPPELVDSSHRSTATPQTDHPTSRENTQSENCGVPDPIDGSSAPFKVRYTRTAGDH